MSDAEHGMWQSYKRGCRCADCAEAWRAYQRDKAAARALRINDIPHGTVKGYQSWMCRCRRCLDAFRAWKRERLATLGADQHGTRTAYGYGCRCDRCTTARSTASRKVRA